MPVCFLYDKSRWQRNNYRRKKAPRHLVSNCIQYFCFFLVLETSEAHNYWEFFLIFLIRDKKTILNGIAFQHRKKVQCSMESRASIRQVIYMDACSVLISYSPVIRILDHAHILCTNQILFIGCREDQFFVGINSHYLQMLQGGILSSPICNMVVYWDNLRYVRFLMMYLLYCDKFLLPSYYMIIDIYICTGKQLYFLFD